MRRIQLTLPVPVASGLRSLGPACRQFGRGLLNLALPPRCLHCNDDLPATAELSLCQKCIAAIAPELPECCRRCGAVLPEGMYSLARCPVCKDFSLKFDAVIPLGRYHDSLRDAVLMTKRSENEAFSVTLGKLMASRLRDKIAQFNPQAVVPIPMHWARRILRGTNSPELLAECLGHALRLPVVRMLVRRRYTSPQKDLLPSERFRNVRNAFAVRRWHRERWKDARLLLVDDILTTGATCSEAARLLKKVGIAAVAVAVVARTDGS